MADIYGNGIKQGDLVDLLSSIKTKFNAILTKLDGDTGVTGTDFNSLWAVSLPSGITTTEAKGIRDQGQVVTFLDTFITNFNAVLAKLDLDGGVADTNYASLWALTDVVDGSRDGIKQIGLFQSSLVKLLDNIIANIAGLNAKIDLDGTVNLTNYASACNVTDNVDSSGTQQRCI